MDIQSILQKVTKQYDNTLSLLSHEIVEVPLNQEHILQIHDYVINTYGGIHGVRDNNLLASICITPYTTYFDTNLYPTIFDKAAKLLYDFCNYQIFLDGNKRTGVAACNALLCANYFELTLSDANMYQLAINIANHTITFDEVAQYIKNNCKIIGGNYDKQHQSNADNKQIIEYESTDEYDSR